MSGFDPLFDAAGTGTRDGSVPAPGAIDGRTFYLRADKSWAVPVGNTPGPQPPAPGPDLNQWACNIAGYLTYEVCRIAVKLAVDWVPVSWIGDIVGGITAGVVRLVLAEDPIIAAIISDMVFHFVQDKIVGLASDALTALLDDVLWAKTHCALYSAIADAPTDFVAALTAAAGVIGAFLGYPAPATAAIAYFLQHLGITDVANIPITAFVQSYNCSTCATTGIGPQKPLLQTSFDLTVTDDTNTRTFVDELEFSDAVISGTAPHAIHTPNVTTNSARGINKPDNTTIAVDGTGTYSVLAATADTTLYSTVGIGKVFQLGSEPSGWQNVGFDDSAWSAPVLETGGGPTPGISGAARITSTNGDVSVSAVFLFRLAFTLAPGAVLSGISTILEDNISTVYINGTEISTYTRPPGDTSGPHATSFDTSLLATNNVLAIKIENGAFGFGSNPMSVEYKLAIDQAAGTGLTVEHGGSVVGTRRQLNLTDGGGIIWTVADDSEHARVNLGATAVGFANPMTTAADLIVGGTAGAPARLAKGSDGQVLTVDPITHLLGWSTPAAPGSGTVTDVGSTPPITSTGGTTPVIGLATPLAPEYGGTGHNLSAAIDGQIPIASSSDHKFTAATLTAGVGISIANAAGSIVVSASGSGGGGTALSQIAVVVVAVATNTVSILSIPQTYTSLMIHWLARSTTASTAWDLMNMRVNNLSTSIYDYEQLNVANGASGSESFNQTSFQVAYALQDSLDSTYWSMGKILIPFYANTITAKTIYASGMGDRHAGGGTMRYDESACMVRDTAGISRLDFIMDGSTFKAGSTFAVYGIA